MVELSSFPVQYFSLIVSSSSVNFAILPRFRCGMGCCCELVAQADDLTHLEPDMFFYILNCLYKLKSSSERVKLQRGAVGIYQPL